ncbi:hypothetical protein [Neptunomonas concharum]|uniref:DUF2059 domain-containing protein n=1 Tax=Neptunomonas concharum TaxID=1031538 RepID=A0A5P1RAY4_9GAMM|nr:hypothetical protein [Neptunomonas concharum]QEQ96442.1 hypothetical protein F0U83_06830 [Neptunomonas concharum]
MLKKIVIFSLLLILSACSKHQPEITAIEFVEKMQLGKNLVSLSFRVSKNTQTFRMLVKELGHEEASSRLEDELVKITKDHQREWNENLANSYLEHFSVAELNSIYYEKRNSQFADKMSEMQKKVGRSMEIKSKDLLNAVATNALSSVFESVQ